MRTRAKLGVLFGLAMGAAALAGSISVRAQEGYTGPPVRRLASLGGGCSGFKYGMALESNPAADDEVFSFGGLRVFVDQMSLPYLKGARVDYVDDELLGQGFKVDNPNAVSSCGCGQSFKAADGEAAPAGAGGGCGSGGCGSH